MKAKEAPATPPLSWVRRCSVHRVNNTDYRRLVDRVVALAEADDRIRAAFVYGSHATGSADRFSDLDIGLVTTDDAFDDVVADGDALVRKLGEPVFLDHFGNPAQLHVIFADGTALELIIDRESELTFEGPHRVLVDKAGVSERAAGRPGLTPESSDGPEQVRQRIQGFWHDVDHLVTALGRGNTWWAFGQLDELRRMVLNLARLEIGLEPDDEAYWKVDGALKPDRLAALQATAASPDLEPMRDAGVALIDLYREVAPTLAASHGIEYPTELDRLLSDRLRGLW